MMDLQAFLFCGGRGTRLYPITDYYQKVMMPVAQSGKPMLEYVIRHLAYHNINDFTALIKYRANQIRRYFGNGERFGVNIDYRLDDKKFPNTGGALLNAKDLIKTGNILLYFTDILSNIDIKKMYQSHVESGKLATIWMEKGWTVDSGIINRGNNFKVTSISKKTSDSIFANTGISIIKAEVFDMIEDIFQSSKNIDLSGDIFPSLANQGEVVAYTEKNWWLDVGSIARHQSIDDLLLFNKFPHLNGGKKY
ncbi:MAG: nucleotidyltransferase family protein [Candidatus Heimdallarchaeota archaeon]|nr:nucleotidyltransferase family protein [Candidatus Heimdallarchaeota archaeon]